MAQPTTRVLTARRATTSRLLAHHRRIAVFAQSRPETDGHHWSPRRAIEAVPDPVRADPRIDSAA